MAEEHERRFAIQESIAALLKKRMSQEGVTLDSAAKDLQAILGYSDGYTTQFLGMITSGAIFRKRDRLTERYMEKLSIVMSYLNISPDDEILGMIDQIFPDFEYDGQEYRKAA